MSPYFYRVDEFLDFWQSGLNAALMQAVKQNLFYKSVLKYPKKDPVQSVGKWMVYL